jgi:hypothetical protein
MVRRIQSYPRWRRILRTQTLNSGKFSLEDGEDRRRGEGGLTRLDKVERISSLWKESCHASVHGIIKVPRLLNITSSQDPSPTVWLTKLTDRSRDYESYDNKDFWVCNYLVWTWL